MSTIYYCYAALILVALITSQVSGEENEWITTISKNGQDSVNNSIKKIKSYGASDDKVMSMTDKSFDEFVKYTKNGIVPIIKKLEENSSEGSSRMKVKINSWLDELDNMNSVSDKYKNTPQNSLKKFEDSIADFVKNSAQFSEKYNTAKPEIREIYDNLGNFMKDLIAKLVTSINTVESQLKNTGNIASKK